MNGPIPAAWSSRLLSALRISAAFLYLVHGTMKWFNVPAMGPGVHIPLESAPGIGGVIETIGGSFLLLGLFARPVAFLCAGEMAYAYFTVHAPRGFFPQENMGELAVLYCFIWLYIAAAGAGPWSLDALRAQGTSPR